MKRPSGHSGIEDSSVARGRLLPVTVVPGMNVVEVTDADVGIVVGITQTYCVFACPETNRPQVAPWRDLALTNICPAAPLLAGDVAEMDRGNANATVLRELLALERLGPLSNEQKAVLDELIGSLCGRGLGDF